MEEFFEALKMLLVVICYLIMWATTIWFLTYEYLADKWWQRLLIVILASVVFPLVFINVVSEKLAKILSKS